MAVCGAVDAVDFHGSYGRHVLEKHPLIRNADLCDGLGVSPATANRILRDLTEDGMIRRVRDGKFWAYQSRE